MMRVSVTKDDIRRGVKNDPNKCAMALAIRRHIKGANVMSFQVKADAVELYFKPTSHSVSLRHIHSPLSKKARKFLNDFDGLTRNKPKPIAFVLQFPKVVRV